jgi:ABC-type transporter Mla subunit MlaD
MVRLPVPGPRDLLRLTTESYQALEQAIALLPRLTTLIGQVERIVQRADAVVTEVERTRQRADQVIGQAGALVERTGTIVDSADELVGRASGLLDDFQPSLSQLAPLADQLARTTSPAEVAAAIALIDHLPLLVTALETDILPILATLDTVAPDVRELLDTTKEFNEILGSVPGLGRIKRRVEERQEILDGVPE